MHGGAACLPVRVVLKNIRVLNAIKQKCHHPVRSSSVFNTRILHDGVNKRLSPLGLASSILVPPLLKGTRGRGRLQPARRSPLKSKQVKRDLWAVVEEEKKEEVVAFAPHRSREGDRRTGGSGSGLDTRGTRNFKVRQKN